MKFKLTIMPAIEVSTQSVEFEFSTLEEVKAAENACANLLLFVQDTIGAMDDYSNMFFTEEFVDGEWVEVEGEA